jgi:hypothetical protein
MGFLGGHEEQPYERLRDAGPWCYSQDRTEREGGLPRLNSTAKKTINSGSKDKYIVTKPKNQWPTVVNFADPLYLDQGEVVNLVSVAPEPVVSDAVNTVVSLLIELNM